MNDEHVWRRIEIPLQSGGSFTFDLPDGCSREAFGEIWEQETANLDREYLRTHQAPDMSAFAEQVQARIDEVGAKA